MSGTIYQQVNILRTRAGAGQLNDPALRRRVDGIVSQVREGNLPTYVAEGKLAALLRQADRQLRAT